jgi:ligand-binding sensor domain-containing protein/DNA-binding CsgD family transcriptional regulator
VQNFSKAEYSGGTQSWDFAQDGDGILYMANNEGLIEFDGVNWALHPVANKTIVRSIAADGKGRIYVGAQGEIGFFSPDVQGRLAYTSFQPLLAQLKRKAEDFWDALLAADGALFFRSGNQIIRIKDGRVQSWYPEGSFLYLQRMGSRIIAQDSRRGIVVLRPDGQQERLVPPVEPQMEIVSILEQPGADPVVCLRNGHLYRWTGGQLLPWQTDADAYLRRHRLYTAIRLADGKIAFGTSQGGVVLLQSDGTVQIVLSRKNGLQNNNVLSLFADRQQNLWVGTDNGIDCIQVNSPYTFLLPDEELEGAGYGAALTPNTGFFATSNGLYTGTRDPSGGWTAASFARLPGTQGQTWGVQNISGELWVSHHEGPFLLSSPLQARRMGDTGGIWTFAQPVANPQLLIAGGYNGVYLFEKKGANWSLWKKIPGIEESCRILALENDRLLWVAHPYRGIFQLRFAADYSSAEVRFFNASKGLPSNNFNHVFKIGDETVFATEKGLYRFDKLRDSFEPYTALNRYFSSYRRVKYLHYGYRGEIWFAADKEAGYLKPVRIEGKATYVPVVLPFLHGKLLGGFEFIYPYDERHVVFGSDKGFIFFDQSRKSILPDAVLIREVRLAQPTDSLLFVSRPVLGRWKKQGLELSARERNLSFKYVLPDLNQQPGIQYRWRLVGNDPAWSEWSPSNHKEFVQLPPGNYRFEVEARPSMGSDVRTTVFPFRIAPPWYRSRTAYSAYILFFSIGLFLLVALPRRRFAREKEHLTLTHQREQEVQQQQVEEAQKEIQLILEAKLEDEIRFKNQELAATTFHLLQKSEILQNTSEQLVVIGQHCPDPNTRRSIEGLIRGLTQSDQFDKDWELFAQRFDQVHSDFLKRLKERFPQITSKDQKLCAYLRLNLNSKEIAPLMGISVRSVEVSRYRLRRKLGLDSEENLTGFLLRF